MEMRVGRRSLSMAIMSCAVITLFAHVSLGQEDERGQGADCSASAIGATPLIDLTEETYHGEEGGLYPGAENTMPAAHLDYGLLHAAEVVPRGPEGEPGPDGAIGFVSVGVSNTFREFQTFTQMVRDNMALEPAVVFVNGAQGGAALSKWRDPESSVWDELDAVVDEAELSPLQIQVAWIKMVARIDDANPAEPFPQDALTYKDDLAASLRTLKQRFPNLAVAYLSSRIYGGYNTETSPSPEPWAYQQGFGVKWTIEAQIEGDPQLFPAPGDDGVVPWIAWGPYLWADGERPRSDGLTWECQDLRGDGVHPSSRGQRKVGEMLIAFLRTEPTAAWMWSDRELEFPGSVTLPAPSTSSSTTMTTTTTISSPSSSTEATSSSSTSDRTTPSASADTGPVWSLLIVAIAGVAWGTGRILRRGRG